MALDSKKELTPVHYSEYSAKVIYHLRIQPGGMTFPLHWHERIELLRIHEGCLVFTCTDHHLTLAPGDVCLISPRMLHSGVAGPEGVMYDVVMFDTSLLLNGTAAAKKYIAPLCDGSCIFEPLVRNDQIRDRVDDIVRAHRFDTQLHPLQVVSALYDLVGLLYKNCVIRDLAALPPQQQFGPVIDYINEHYAEPISSAMLSRKFGYDEAYFCRKFKKHTGLTVMRYIQILRMEQARRLLAETEMPIKDIATQCGFTDTAYFANRFKSIYRSTPSQIREFSRKGKKVHVSSKNYKNHA